MNHLRKQNILLVEETKRRGENEKDKNKNATLQDVIKEERATNY